MANHLFFILTLLVVLVVAEDTVFLMMQAGDFVQEWSSGSDGLATQVALNVLIFGRRIQAL